MAAEPIAAASPTERSPRPNVPSAVPVLLSLVFFIPAAVVAVLLPYHEWDALSFGQWSRLIALHHHFHFAAVGDVYLQRPVFFVAQGGLWAVFGFHEWLGRLLSLGFTALLAWSAYSIGCSFAGPRADRRLVGTLALAAALGSREVAQLAAAGLTDVPVAATAALTAAIALSPRARRVRTPLLVASAALTVLTKPTGLLPVAGLALALFAFGGGARRDRVKDVVWLGLGTAIALAYDEAQAIHLHERLRDVLHAGVTSYYTAQAAKVRAHVLLRGDWLGVELRLVLLYSLLYGVARAMRASHRSSALFGLALGLLWSIGGPVLADGGTPYPLTHPASIGFAVWLLTVALLLASTVAPGVDGLPPRTYAFLLVWLLPAAVVWIIERTDYLRLLSPAWPALMILIGCALAETVWASGSLRRVGKSGFVAALALASALVLANVEQLDALGASGWHDVLHLGSGVTDPERRAHIVLGPTVYELSALRRNIGNGTIVSSDGKLGFHFPGRLIVAAPARCEALLGSRMFVVLLDSESSAVMRANGGDPDPLAWQQCGRPRLYEVAERSGVFAAFTIGRPTTPPDAADCGIRPSGGTLWDAVLANDLSYRAAAEATRRAHAAGFTSARLERTNCDRYRVVVTGVPDAQNAIAGEARRAGFPDTRIVAAARYPEVSPSVASAG